MNEITGAFVDDFFALAGEGHKPRCPECFSEMRYDYEHDTWECPKGCEGNGR